MTAFKRLYKGQPGTSSAAIYTAGAGVTAIIRGIRAVNADSSARWVRIGTDGTADGDLLLPQWSLDPSGMESDDGLIIVEATTSLYARAEVAAKITVHVYGVEV